MIPYQTEVPQSVTKKRRLDDVVARLICTFRLTQKTLGECKKQRSVNSEVIAICSLSTQFPVLESNNAAPLSSQHIYWNGHGLMWQRGPAMPHVQYSDGLDWYLGGGNAIYRDVHPEFADKFILKNPVII